MKQRIHVFGASGSGTTTIAQAVCAKLNYRHFDSDNYFWLPTEEPFTVERSREERIKLLGNDLKNCQRWVLSGSLTGWGDMLIPYFDLVVFVYVPQDIRLERLKKREQARYGDAVLPGGRRYEATQDFLEWATSYDAGTSTGRSLDKHEKWLAGIACPVLRLVNDSLEESVDVVSKAIREAPLPHAAHCRQT